MKKTDKKRIKKRAKKGLQRKKEIQNVRKRKDKKVQNN
jgi:hypothetical protein